MKMKLSNGLNKCVSNTLKMKNVQKRFQLAQKICRKLNVEQKSERDIIMYLYMYCESQLKIKEV